MNSDFDLPAFLLSKLYDNMDWTNGWTLSDAFGKPSPGRRFVRAYWENGVFHLPEGLNSNGVLASMVGCNCLLDVPAGSDALKPGDPAEAILL